MEAHFFVVGYSTGVAPTTGADALALVRRDRSASSTSLGDGAGDGARCTAMDMVSVQSRAERMRSTCMVVRAGPSR